MAGGRRIIWLLLPMLVLAFKFITQFALNYNLALDVPLDPLGNMLGKDYSVFWTASKMALAGNIGDIYNGQIFIAHLKEFSPNAAALPFVYPPSYLMLIYPLALLPYLYSYLSFCLGSLVVFFALASGSNRLGFIAALVVVLSAPFLYSLLYGQNGIVFSSLIFGVVYYHRRNKALAGFLAALVLVSKPHLAILIPVFLLAKKNWRALFYMAGFGVLLVLLSILCFGLGIWITYINHTLGSYAEHKFTQAIMLTMFTSFRETFGALFYLPFLVVSGFCLGFAFHYWRRHDWLVGDFGVLAVVMFVVCPYYLLYDMVLLSIAVVLVWSLSSVYGRLQLASLFLLLIPNVVLNILNENKLGFEFYGIYLIIAAAAFFWELNRIDKNYEKDIDTRR